MLQAVKGLEGNPDVFLIDSFMGLSKPEPEDGHYWKEGDMTLSVEKLTKNL